MSDSGTRALALIHVAVQRRRGMAFAAQADRQRLGVALGGDEYDALGHVDVGQKMIEDAVLVRVVVGEVNALVDLDGRFLVRLDFDTDGIPQQP